MSSVAVIGCGYWGQNLVRNFHQLEALRAIVEPTDGGRRLAATLAPGVAVFSHIEPALDDPSVTSVVVATPADTHVTVCRQALAAGKDVFCEKPLALTFEGAERVYAEAEQAQRILMVGHLLEYHPAITRLRELVASGDLGEIHYLYSRRLNLGKIRRDVDILWSFAPHDIAVILRLAGQMPTRVVATGGTFVQPGVADVTVSQLLFGERRGAHIFVSWLNPFKEQRLVVVGSKRMASFDDISKELLLYDQRVDIYQGEIVPVRSKGTPIPFSQEEPLRLECQAFLDAVKTRRAPLTDGASALRVLRVLEALGQSLLARGNPVDLASNVLV